MEAILETLRGLVAGHERQLLVAAELAVLGTLLIALVYRLRKSRGRTVKPAKTRPDTPTARIQAEKLYRQEEPESARAPMPAEAATEISESFPPELSRRIDVLEKKMKGLALRARP